jgi:hypothetical protein
MQLAAEYLGVQTKLMSPVLLETANCTQMFAYAIAKFTNASTFRLLLLIT